MPDLFGVDGDLDDRRKAGECAAAAVEGADAFRAGAKIDDAIAYRSAAVAGNLLMDALPRMFRARAAQDWLSKLALAGVGESERASVGGEVMLARLADLMFVDVIRQHIDSLPEQSRGWLAGLRDRHVGAALGLIHERPAEDWTLERLARQ